VLVVDDEPSVRGAMRRALEQQGYRVVEASSGADALARLETATDGLHLVVCDLVLPQMSGETLGRAIGLRWPALPML
jgi:CheY-like chemotaxis protein